MSGNVVLRACMHGLVVVNLVFVQLTEATGPEWLVPLFFLTIFSPLWTRLKEKFVYRQLWNIGVLGVFGVLVRHASGYDLRYVLEDGLVLAALCQVHLLNNLRSDQRPDLLFWNSFLIAVATGYLSQDLVYPFAFLVYVPLYVIGLQLLCISRIQRDIPPAPTRRVVRDGMVRSSVMIVFTLAVFLFWPRDFHRPSLLTGEFDLSPPGDSLEIGFSEELKLDKKGRARASDRVVMTAKLVRGSAADVPTLWRGATLASTDGKEWWPPSDQDFASWTTGDDPWYGKGGHQYSRRRVVGTSGVSLSIEHVDAEASRLFLPLSAERVTFGRGIQPRLLRDHPDATLEYDEPKLARPPLLYDVVLMPNVEAPSGDIPERLDRDISRYIALPRSRRVLPAETLAERLASREPADASQHEIVTTFRSYLETRYTYLPPGATGSAESLEEFLAGDSGGHCEYFASALATMLRSRGIPSRVVTGYRSSEWDSTGDKLVVRRRHAHAWVEVLDPTAGWYAVDPNPVSALGDGVSLWDQVHAGLSNAWTVLAGFDADQRAQVLAWARAQPGRAWRAVGDNPESAALVIALALLSLIVMRRLHGRGMAISVFSYRRAMRRAGLALAEGETPRELLDRARSVGISESRLALLVDATEEHERARYAA